MSTEQNKAIALEFYKAFDNSNVEAAKKVMATNLIAHTTGSSEPLDLDGFIEYGLMMRAAFPDGKHTFEDVIVEGDKVVTRGTFSGTHEGELLGFPPTGEQVKFSVMHIDRIVDGKVTEHWGQADIIALMQQLGILPPLG
ncbi:ester cyclase [Nostoc sp. FACHB-152]|uniref:ester cyclase n=1 Tax=unclassified Nostoc TaxID=2593658 RepID=UPI001684E272|nr:MULTISPECIES: ester cyclase [unclassified Nostoc]MBD2451022.1 ester cyclase [Nostoc sp. FACHB-152]MBD2472090.1 ester cyclase [Nostoc sp. FACHB-145]